MIRQGFGGGNTSGPIDVAACLTAKGQRIDFEVETFVAHSLRGEGFDASEDGTGRGTPLVPVAFPLTAGMSKSAARMPQEQGALLPVAFDCKGSEAQVDLTGATPTLRAMGHSGSHANAGGQLAVAFDLRGREGGAMLEGPHGTANIRAASGGSSRSYIATRWAVRRLTPLECERLQGFPDGYTDVPYRKRNWTPDGPRYKALGNSMAVNAMDWLGQRIEYVRTILAEQERKS